ncbi:hypothetical protein [Alkalicoccus daliensis]|uniref:Uncharacterized protein n=1 Tax=Alkalicoccus daliensis TaxID=745820 RepID=A0A1H0F3B6_9BACI|nr:hypothetical protein [Alkalicoccus daliensis]SDN89154.1 hypothetical protein SAMN04488053_104173 [Alkalicoccus daliensis]
MIAEKQVNQSEVLPGPITRVDEYIFAPFNTYTFLNLDDVMFSSRTAIQNKLVKHLDGKDYEDERIRCNVRWGVEDSNNVKKAKGVFANVGNENSLIYASLECLEGNLVIHESIGEIFKGGVLEFEDVRFYFQESGVGTCSAKISITHPGMSLKELEKVSEELNRLFKVYFEKLCYVLSEDYIEAVKDQRIQCFSLDFMPVVTKEDIGEECIPWTHRVYHIHGDELFELENPGQPFQYILTPSKREDIQDISIYENRYIYFGWGHSIILTKDGENDYFQTKTNVHEYIRLIQISQSNWQCFDLLTKIVEMGRVSFSSSADKKKIKKLKSDILTIRYFNRYVDQILDNASSIKVTFDTEKRNLLKELNSRWQIAEIIENIKQKMLLVEELLDFLYYRQKEHREEKLSTVLFCMAVLSISQIIAILIDYSQDIFQYESLTKIILLCNGVFITILTILIFFRFKN